MQIADRKPADVHSVLGVALLLALLLGGCSKEVEEPGPPPIRPVKLVHVEGGSLARTMTLPALIEATKSVDLTFQVGGSLQEFPVRSGQQVAKGDLIGRLETRDFQNKLTQAKSEFDAATAEFERAERLIVENAISRSIFDQRKFARNAARAALDSAQKAAGDAVLRSPFDGLIAQVHASRYQNVSAQEKIVTLQTTGAAEAVVQLPASLVANSGRIETEETVLVLDAAQETQVPAQFYSIALDANPDSQTYEAKFTFSPPEGLTVLPGMTGTLQSRFRVSTDGAASEQIQIPATAVLTEGEGRYVWVVDMEAMTVARRAVELEPGVGASLTVNSGLALGETIVGAGANYLFEGAKVRPYES